jgi:hypothetical protein
MTEHAPITRQVQIDDVGEFCNGVGRILQDTGLQPAQAGEILSGQLQAVCVQCGLSLSGVELFQLARAAEDNALPPARPKLQRIKQGYCGRDGCNCLFYEVRFAPSSEIDWLGILERMEQQNPTLKQTPAGGADAQAQVAQAATKRKRKRFLVVGLVLLAALIIFRCFFWSGSFPGFHKEPKFKIDPASIRDHSH